VHAIKLIRVREELFLIYVATNISKSCTLTPIIFKLRIDNISSIKRIKVRLDLTNGYWSMIRRA